MINFVPSWHKVGLKICFDFLKSQYLSISGGNFDE